ncbi:MAG: SoxR reducing system RseC family protein [Desulfatitalea sp.]|nr:SoxR reducing system RseC family protein [Desulfatitalea sp.]
MAIEQGIVIRMGAPSATTAWVKTVRTSACEACASKDHCNPGHGGQEQEVEAINLAGARVGDRIQLAIRTGVLLKAMFLLYIFPILCMLFGGIAGNWLAPRLNAAPSTAAMISAFVCFAAALVIVRIGGQRMGSREEYRPKIIRILARESQGTVEENNALPCPRQDLMQG